MGPTATDYAQLSALLLETSKEKEIPLDESKIDLSREYLSRLLSSSLSTLLNEPLHLSEIKKRNETQLCDLSFEQYRAFLQVHECAEDIEVVFSELNAHLSNMLETIPKLEASSTEFQNNSKEIMDARNISALLLQQHDRILDILEIPALVDTCVRNGYYSEAMDLALHMQKLAGKYEHNQLIKDLERQVHRVMQLMLNQLLQVLKEPIKLPTCIKVVDYIRRMHIFNEPELQLVFLILRNTHLKAQLSSLSKESDPARYLKSYVDVLREHFFDTTSQYQEVFMDLSKTTTIGFAQSESLFGKEDAAAPHATPFIENSTRILLSDYVLGIINDFLQILENYVPKLQDAAAISALMTQIGYCGHSLGRVGIDFRQLTVPIFETAVRRLYIKTIEEGTNEFLTMITYAITHGSNPKWMILEGSKREEKGGLVSLLETPLLSYLLNVFLTSLNSLRLLAPLSLASELEGILLDYIKKCSEAIKSYGEVILDEKESDEIKVMNMEAFLKFKKAYVDVLVPYILECYGKIYKGYPKRKDAGYLLGLEGREDDDETEKETEKEQGNETEMETEMANNEDAVDQGSPETESGSGTGTNSGSGTESGLKVAVDESKEG